LLNIWIFSLKICFLIDRISFVDRRLIDEILVQLPIDPDEIYFHIQFEFESIDFPRDRVL